MVDGFGYADYKTTSTGIPTFYLQVLDASDPESLYTRGSVGLPFYIADVELVAGYAYVSTESGGLYLCEVSDPDNPYIVGALSTRDCVSQAAPAGGYILIAHETGGLQVAPLDCSAFAGVVMDIDPPVSDLVNHQGLAGAYPNPFHVTMKGRVSLSIYDVAGARVASLVDRALDAGGHTATFDGQDLAPGIYFATLETRGRKFTKKVVLVK